MLIYLQNAKWLWIWLSEFFFLFNACARRTSSPSNLYHPFHLFFGSFLSRRLKIKCILLLQNYRCVKRNCIAFPQTARLPDFCALLSFLVFFFFYGRHLSEYRGFRHKRSLSPSSLFLSHHLENIFLNRDSILFVQFFICLPYVGTSDNDFVIETCVCSATTRIAYPFIRLEINQKIGESTVSRLTDLRISRSWSDFEK